MTGISTYLKYLVKILDAILISILDPKKNLFMILNTILQNLW